MTFSNNIINILTNDYNSVFCITYKVSKQHILNYT